MIKQVLYRENLKQSISLLPYSLNKPPYFYAKIQFMKLNNIKTIGIVALSGCVEKGKIESAKINLEKLGYHVKLSKNIYEQKRYLAGDDEEKLEELYKFFTDPDIDMIMAARGGYGVIRLINKIDYEIIKNNPKPFCGFSDVTALLLMIYKKAAITTLHGPMICSDFADNLSEFTISNFEKAINRDELIFKSGHIIKDGSAKGIIWGGNLATVVSLCGVDFLPEEDFIFFTEDLNEPVYKIDRMFQQLLNIKEFTKKCKGVILGDFLSCGNEEWLNEYFEELTQILKVPVYSGFKITHSKDKLTIPIGQQAVMDHGNLIIF